METGVLASDAFRRGDVRSGVRSMCLYAGNPDEISGLPQDTSRNVPCSIRIDGLNRTVTEDDGWQEVYSRYNGSIYKARPIRGDVKTTASHVASL